MLVGVALVLAGVAVGWQAGRYRSLIMTRLIRWWVGRVVMPLILSPSWWRRAATIFVNNASISAGVVALGAWAVTGWAAVAGLGVSLGVGFRVLSDPGWGLSTWRSSSDLTGIRRMRVGVMLNLLEPPAIAVTVGLCLARSTLGDSLPAGQVWQTFGVCVAPALLIAACGESLWLGIARIENGS